ncbi:MAG: hypothetical protein U0228_26460 [Myxococcaceae bacterium]
MSDEKPDDAPRKILMPEVLPRPMSFPGTAARARVIAHLRLLATTGVATLSLAACPFLVVDPLPPPAKCKTSGVSADLVADVTAGGNLRGDAGVLSDGGLPDGGTLDLFTLSLRSKTNGFDINALLSSTNASVVELNGQLITGGLFVVFAPIDASQPVSLRFNTTCEGGVGVALVAELTPGGTNQYSVKLTDAP